jgi:hypothetical protein
MNKPPHLTIVASEQNTAAEQAPKIAQETSWKRTLPPLTGKFELGSDGTTFIGYIDIGKERRINCMLLTQKDPSILKLEQYHLEAPTGTTFEIIGPSSD